MHKDRLQTLDEVTDARGVASARNTMGFADSLKSPFKSTAGETEAVDPAEHRSAPDGDAQSTAIDEKHSEVLVEGGVTTIEAAQAIWGKSGRWIVIAG